MCIRDRPSICPPELREAVWRLAHWVLSRSDAGRLDHRGLVELMVARATPLPRALARGDADADADEAQPEEGGGGTPEEAANEADAMAGLGERGGLGDYLLSPAACGVLAHLAFDATAEFVEMRDFFGALHALLSGCLLYTSPSPRDATLSRMPSSA